MRPGEEPIKIYIYPFLSSKYAGSHAAMTYRDKCIDYGPQGFRTHDTRTDAYARDCEIYYIYPSEVGINPDKLIEAMENLPQRRSGNDYNYLRQNCAGQVMACLQYAGAQGLEGGPVGIAIPTLLGANSLDDWCEQHGHLSERRLSTDEYNNALRDVSSCMQMLTNPEQFKAESRRIYNEGISRAQNMTNREQVTNIYMDKAKFFNKTPDEITDYLINLFNRYKDDQLFVQDAARRMETYFPRLPADQRAVLINNGICPTTLRPRLMDTQTPSIQSPSINIRRNRDQNQIS